MYMKDVNTQHAAIGPNEPESIQITVKDGVPCAVTFKRRRLTVAAILNRWRIDEEWWRTAISRMYYRLELQNHVRLTVFHDLLTDGWYHQNGA